MTGLPIQFENCEKILESKQFFGFYGKVKSITLNKEYDKEKNKK